MGKHSALATFTDGNSRSVHLAVNIVITTI
jgi:hypothetical protein